MMMGARMVLWVSPRENNPVNEFLTMQQFIIQLISIYVLNRYEIQGELWYRRKETT